MDEDIPIERVVQDAFGLAEDIYVQARENEEDVEDLAFQNARGEYAEMAAGENVDFMSTDGSSEDLNNGGREASEELREDAIQRKSFWSWRKVSTEDSMRTPARTESGWRRLRGSRCSPKHLCRCCPSRSSYRTGPRMPDYRTFTCLSYCVC
jgi:hypothetical protein